MSNIPSIAMIPSAYKSGKLYSVLPSDGSADLNFARTSEATRVNQNSLIETVGSNVPRIDYKDGGCPKLLLEPQRTNIIPYSEDFSNAAWIKGNSTINANQVISPDGTLNADLIVTSAAGGGVSDGIGGSGDYSFSVFAKYKDIQFIRLRSTNSYAWFDIENGSVGNTISALDATIENYGNGWYRCTLVGNNTNTLVQVTCTEQNGANVGFGSVYLWGAQVEEGSYPTSYIPTSGATATRNAETSSKANISNLINSSEGVLYFETKGFIDVPTFSRYIQLSKNGETGFNNSLIIQHRNNGFLRIYANGTGTSDVHFNIDIDFTQNHKIAVLYKLNGYKLFIDGVSQPMYLTPTQTVFSGLDTLSFAYRGTYEWNGSIKDVRVYNKALTDQELIALTS